MDIITQGLLGSTAAQAGYSTKIGRKAAFYGFVIGLLPDFDILAGMFGPWASLKYHRGLTHSFVALTLLSIPTGMLCKRLARSDVEQKHWIGLAFLSMITHPIIDWFTAYGTSLWWPFNDRRYAIDALSIIDPVFSFPLLVATLAGLFAFSTPMRLKKLAIAALLICALYAGYGYHNSQSMVAMGIELFRAEGFEPIETRANPTFMNISVFRVVGCDAAGNIMATYLKTASKQPLTPIFLHKSDTDEFALKAMQHEHAKLFKWFAMGMLQVQSIVAPDGKHKVLLNDMRYGLMTAPDKPLFSAEVEFDLAGNVTGVTRRHARASASLNEEFKKTMAHVFSGEFQTIDADLGAK
ncbi:MAG: metal-dependent hydrolase [Candidatus Riflebacteria bacterium]|nr:metal-dependent hydrolase [Candidatus Riflebacteria bacterium]